MSDISIAKGNKNRLDPLKLPPHSVEAEQSLLGGLMLDKRSWDEVADLLKPDDFYRKSHQLIYEAMLILIEKDLPPDAITVNDYLDKQGDLDSVGGLPYITKLIQDTPSASNIRAYAKIVREKSILRSLIQVGGDIASSVYSIDDESIEQLVDLAEQKVFDIADGGNRGSQGFRPLKDLVADSLVQLDILSNQEGSITGVATGFAEMDDKTSGLQPGDLVVVAGRPSMGKTTLAINIAENASIGNNIPTGIFSLEMPAEQISFRMIGSIARVNQTRLRNGNLSDEDWPRINSAVSILSDAPIYIDDTPALTPTSLRARARRLKRQHNLGLIVVDYLQLMQSGTSSENRATEISEITRSLKALARELSIPVIALSQLNRSVDSRTDKRPQMSDLRESGAIEQDADVIFFIYREEVYDNESPKKGIAEIILAKQRNGPIGDFNLTFIGEFTKFENLISDAYGEGVSN
ncbi:MAG: replicative DNA helicase [Gammaproteobacteria bacterium TMED78]|nr:MAG: replicative DNA helicase [Gammaproteobacteria bacterium TMED78]|tara:strand:+ start:1792 stop:3186 length:1395 start_codon:yes stop_codon:yes gene_type:complete